MPMIGSIGGCQIVKIEEEFSIKNVALFKPYGKTCGEWLNSLINSDFIARQFDLNSTGGVQAFVSLGSLRNLLVPIIPESEQIAISEFLTKEDEFYLRLIKEVKRSTSLLKERRSSLISAVVTGQIDVRNLSPKEATP